MKKISVCIPTYEMQGLGYIYLRESFNKLLNQTYKNFEIVISDHSKNNLIENLCKEYRDSIEIFYYKNTQNIGNASANINYAMKKTRGDIIKILFQDDFLYTEKSLEEIADNFDTEKDAWMVTASTHTNDGTTLFKSFYPKYNNNIHLGKNTISSPSVLVLNSKNLLFFDENLKWLMDCDYYKRCYNTFGKPKILNKILIVNRIGAHQSTNTIANQKLRIREYKYILKKYEHGWRFIYLLFLGLCVFFIKKIIKNIWKKY